ncbi:hypothetical protein H2200_013376 [Cladophialophora chaetospira]|uniref:Uncharacterized protein n=1 Tax=Cladophialophora chaetospira TaxID=386627 RepID=A0AA38U9I4_9EURO|nr:hypothetical protein H2200_013376 [Cladophialophora chaetospira]
MAKILTALTSKPSASQREYITMSLRSKSGPRTKVSSHQALYLYSVSSRKAQLEQNNPDPDLRKVIGHANILAETEKSFSYNPYQPASTLRPSYLTRTGRRVFNPPYDPPDDEYGNEDAQDSMNRTLSAHAEDMKMMPPSLGEQTYPSSTSSMEPSVLSAHRTSYQNLVSLSPTLASGQVRATVVFVEEMEVGEGFDTES